MGITESTTYSIICDHDSCFKYCEEAESVLFAKENARDVGFVEVDGKWFCEKHARRQKRMKNK